MSRALVLGVVAVLVVLALGLGIPGLWRDVPSPTGGSQTGGDSLADLMLDLQIIPIDHRPAKAFTLETLDGKRLAMSELAGRPILLYFWASW